MKKNTMKRNISAINKISKKMPKTINEAIDFNEEPYSNENLLIDDEEDMETPEVGGEEQGGNPNASEKARQLIDDIRKMSLRAMAELADTPEDENYIMLKKVWSMTDRKPEQEKNNMQPMK
jgi:hypothetical protein